MKTKTRLLFLFFILAVYIEVSHAASDGGKSSMPGVNATFFYEDFSGGIPAGWQNIDNAGNGVVWKWTKKGSFAGDTLSRSGTTAANGYMIFDSDSAAGVNGENASLISVAINCSGKTNVHLFFNEYFLQYNGSQGQVAVSNDNTTWTIIHLAHAGLSPNTGTPNPYSTCIDISSLADNQPTLYIRFQYIGDWDYWWMVDDVALSSGACSPIRVEELQSKGGVLLLYPNPAGTRFMISDLRLMIGKKMLLEMYDALGERVLESEITKNKPEIDVSALSKGLYFVKVTDGEQVRTGKVVVE